MISMKPATSLALIVSLVFSLGLVQEAFTQVTSSPPAQRSDVSSVDTILDALYDVISGPASEARDWDRFRSLFAAGARLIPVVADPSGSVGLQVWTPQDYVDRAGSYLESSGFFEREISRTTEAYGHITHAFSTYESRRAAEDEDPFARGINSIQLLNDGTRWWIVSIFWDSETDTQPLPDKYLPRG